MILFLDFLKSTVIMREKYIGTRLLNYAVSKKKIGFSTKSYTYN